ncbi:MAG: bifunctional pyr operon transcriptional regulator/uracil phosphoribosyltransferase PyrR [Saprospiraceae bacterium]|nr:bifunctional pyr operon transcriptional regulator/uracil phosphoribosyltransferase PyrR [Saprospiraceae bacterium]MDW8229446.1 bifunctional pyr operon transcriptional regulator/uracil phosphoribosyltransferase PyrR [Saprospiraceae bacterium]
MSSEGKLLLSDERFRLTIERLCHQVLEDWEGFQGACVVGIQPRGVPLADRIYQQLSTLTRRDDIPYGRLDITFYRDDFRLRDTPLTPYPNEMNFLISNKKVLLVDDVLYTGRTIQAALAALQHYGRPERIELMALVDRRFNRHLPIQADYVGLVVDALDEAYVKVHWQETHGRDEVLFFEKR